MDKGAAKRLRFLVSNTGVKSASTAYVLQVAETATCSSGTYADVAQSSAWQMVDSTYFANTDASINSSGLTDPAALHL